MLRFHDSAVPASRWQNATVRAQKAPRLPQPSQCGHTGRIISELNSWPACTSGRCDTRNVTAASVRFEAAVVAYTFCVGAFHS